MKAQPGGKQGGKDRGFRNSLKVFISVAGGKEIRETTKV